MLLLTWLICPAFLGYRFRQDRNQLLYRPNMTRQSSFHGRCDAASDSFCSENAKRYTASMSKSLADYLSEVRRAIPIGEILGDPQAKATAPINDSVDLSKYRPVTPLEQAVITAMLNGGGPVLRSFLPQLEGMMVQSNCTCGCPSLAFAPPPDSTRIDLYRQNVLAQMTGEARDGLVGLILWQAGGKLTGLEAYDLAGRDHPFELPRPETLATDA